MKTNLRNIATIQSGRFANTVVDGDVVYLQARHFDEDGCLKRELHPDLKENGISERHLLRAGDILFAAKGTKNFAAVFEEHNPPAMASTSFLVVRIVERGLLPEFLSWYMNHPIAQKFLKSQAMGSAIPSISKVTLEDLEIPVPPIQSQRAILRIADLRKKEKSIIQKLDSLRQQQIQYLILNTLS